MPPLPKSDLQSPGRILAPTSQTIIGLPTLDEVQSQRSVRDERAVIPTIPGKELHHHTHRHGRKSPVSFFEDADTLAEIVARNKATKKPAKRKYMCKVQPDRRIRKSLLDDVPPVQVPQSDVPSTAKAEQEATVKAWRYNEVKEHFCKGFEKQQGRKLFEAAEQMESEIHHFDRTLTAVHRRKVALLYHMKYLSKALRKNIVQARHAETLENSIGTLIKETSEMQHELARQARMVNVGVRSQLVQMKDYLWTKLGMKEYKPEEDEPVVLRRPPPPKKGKKGKTASKKNKKEAVPAGDPLHIDGEPDIARMAQVQRLLDPENFHLLAKKPGGLLAAQQYLTNYLKQCAEVYVWMDSMKITYPTKTGYRQALLKNMPYYTVDVEALFAGLKPAQNTLQKVEGEFLGESFVREAQKEIKTVAQMFLSEPLAEKHPEEPHPQNVFEKIVKTGFSSKLKKKRQDNSLMSFEDFAVKHDKMFRFTNTPYKVNSEDQDLNLYVIEEERPRTPYELRHPLARGPDTLGEQTDGDGHHRASPHQEPHKIAHKVYESGTRSPVLVKSAVNDRLSPRSPLGHDGRHGPQGKLQKGLSTHGNVRFDERGSPNSKLHGNDEKHPPNSPQPKDHRPDGYSENLSSSPFSEPGSPTFLSPNNHTLSPQITFKANQKAGEMAVHKARDTHRASLNPDQRRLIPEYAASTIAALRTKSTTDTDHSKPH